jgi:hypothetical protein
MSKLLKALFGRRKLNVFNALAEAENVYEIIKTRAFERAVPYLMALILRALQTKQVRVNDFAWTKIVAQSHESLQIFAYAMIKFGKDGQIDLDALEALDNDAEGRPATLRYKQQIEPELPGLPEFATEHPFERS